MELDKNFEILTSTLQEWRSASELIQHIIPTLFILLWDGSRKVIVMIMAKLPRLELGHGITRYYRFSRPTPYQLGLKLHLVAGGGFEHSDLQLMRLTS